MSKIYQAVWRHEQGLPLRNAAISIVNWHNEWRYFRLRLPGVIALGVAVTFAGWQLAAYFSAVPQPAQPSPVQESTMHYVYPQRDLPEKIPDMLPPVLPAETTPAVPLPEVTSDTPDLRERLEQAIREQNAGAGVRQSH